MADLQRIISYVVEHNPKQVQTLVHSYPKVKALISDEQRLVMLVEEYGDEVTEAILAIHPDRQFLETDIELPVTSPLAATSEIVQEDNTSGIKRYWQDSRVKLGILLVLLVGLIALLAWKYQD